MRHCVIIARLPDIKSMCAVINRKVISEFEGLVNRKAWFRNILKEFLFTLGGVFASSEGARVENGHRRQIVAGREKEITFFELLLMGLVLVYARMNVFNLSTHRGCKAITLR